MLILNLIERWHAIKALIKSDEYFLTVANTLNDYDIRDYSSIKYEYMNNTDRKLFYAFVKDYINKAGM